MNFTYLKLKSACCSMPKGFNVTCLLYKYEHVFVLSYAETPSSSLMTSTGLCSHGRCAPKSSNRSMSLTASITAVTPSLFGTFTSSPSLWSWHVQTHTNTNTKNSKLNCWSNKHHTLLSSISTIRCYWPQCVCELVIMKQPDGTSQPTDTSSQLWEN